MPKRKQASCGSSEKITTKRKRPECDDKEIYTLKFGLNGFVKSDVLRLKIQNDVEEISRLSYEASLYIYYDVMEKLEDPDYIFTEPIRFVDYFYALLNSKKHSPTTNYNNIRCNFGLRKYDKSYRSNLFVATANMYETQFENNIWMHGWHRVKRFLHKTNELATKKDLYDSTMFLFSNDEKFTIANTITVLPQHWTRGYFHNLKHKNVLYSRLRDFYIIWTTNDSKDWKNFKLVPTFKLGRRHINYDTFAFYQLLCSCKLVPKTMNAKNTKMINSTASQFQVNVNWNEYLNLPKNKEYSGSFSTDGVTCCIHLKRPKRINSLDDKINKEQIVLPTDTYIGIDPGLRLFLGGVRVIGGNPYTKENITHIKYKSSRYHFECGKSSRAVKLEKWTFKQNNIEKSRPGKQTWREFISFALKHMEELQLVFLHKKIARLKFDGYIRREKTIAKIIRDEFVKDATGKVVVFFGNGKTSNNSPMKGYIRSPHTKFIQQLKRHHQIQFVDVDEYNTTKVCSSCLSKDHHTISKSPHRFSSCKECKIVWNRDVNAGLNILYIGYQLFVEKNHTYSIRCAK